MIVGREFIEADLQTTWPAQLREALSAHAKDVAAYHSERARIDRAAETDVLLRVQRPRNPHQGAWDSLLKTSEGAVAGRRLLGFHATRLTNQEVADIKANGMKILSENLLDRRLSSIEASGGVAASVIDALRSRNKAGHSNRSGRTHFCFSRALLRSESGMRRLFQSWGGEALYACHEDDPQVGPALNSIGNPCIVVAAIPVEDIVGPIDVGERLVNVWCSSQAINTDHAPDFQGTTRKDTAASNIVGVMEFSAQDFQALTGHQGWRKPLT